MAAEDIDCSGSVSHISSATVRPALFQNESRRCVLHLICTEAGKLLNDID
jgi:hypothetical protein